MREIRTSGSMSGDEKRSVAAWPKLPRSSSTLPSRAFAAVQQYFRSNDRTSGTLRATTTPLRDWSTSKNRRAFFTRLSSRSMIPVSGGLRSSSAIPGRKPTHDHAHWTWFAGSKHVPDPGQSNRWLCVRYGPIIIDPLAATSIAGLTQGFPSGELWGLNGKVFVPQQLQRGFPPRPDMVTVIPMISFEKLHVRVLLNYVTVAASEFKLQLHG
jgi:hypothetical protein